MVTKPPVKVDRTTQTAVAPVSTITPVTMRDVWSVVDREFAVDYDEFYHGFRIGDYDADGLPIEWRVQPYRAESGEIRLKVSNPTVYYSQKENN